MQVKIEPSWQEALQPEFDQPYFAELAAFVRNAYATSTVYPPAGKIFNAFQHCPLSAVKVVIIGQDPYHEPNQAQGLCFSVADGIPFPPSLSNIFKEIQNEYNTPLPPSGDLTRWADQGILLLNATLTVEAGKAGSHQNRGWERFTDAVIRQVSKQRQHVVFLLWGSYAQKKRNLIDTSKHCVLCSAHPSPLSAYRGFLGNGHFKAANDYLLSTHQTPIVW